MARGPGTLLLLLLLCSSSFFALAQVDDLIAKVEKAEDIQADGKPISDPIVSNIIDSAGPAELASGDGDIDTTNKCEADVKYFCSTIKPGEGRLAMCISNQIEEEEKGSVIGRKTTTECREEVGEFKIDRATNINKDIPLALACKDDAEKFCNTSSIYPEPGAVLTCLRYKSALASKTIKLECASSCLLLYRCRYCTINKCLSACPHTVYTFRPLRVENLSKNALCL